MELTKDYYSVTEVSKILDMTVYGVCKLISRGKLEKDKETEKEEQTRVTDKNETGV